MTVQVRLEDQTLVIEDEGRLVAGRHYSQLVFTEHLYNFKNRLRCFDEWFDALY